MSLFQPKYKSKGKVVKAAKWWIAFRGPTGTVHKWGLQTDSKDIAEIMESQLNSLTMWASKKMEPPKELVAWVQRQEPDFRQKIYDAQLLPAGKISQTRTITELLSDWLESMRLNKSEANIGQDRQKIETINGGCGFRYWQDVTGRAIEDCILRLTESGLSRHTGQHYIRAFRRFARWLKKSGHITEVPEIVSMQYKQAKRRSFEYEEFSRLLETVQTEPTRRGLTGYQRYVLYQFAVNTGLRLDEIASLTKDSFNFERREVTVYCDETKNDRLACQKMTLKVTAMVKDLTKNMLPGAQVFYLTNMASETIQKDCRAAGIEVDNHRGKITFHSTRHTCATFMINAGVPVNTVQAIMRHSTPELTLRYYTHQLIGGVDKAMSVFENLEKSPLRKQA